MPPHAVADDVQPEAIVEEERVFVRLALAAQLRRGIERPPLDPYGATDPGEFFAVATEAFFDAAVPLRENEPALYDVLARFYAQDPAAWPA